MQQQSLRLFSEVLVEKTFESVLEKQAYLTGAFCKAIIDSSWHSGISKGNTTFKKWLSNQPITEGNLLKIFDKALWFMGRLKLDSARNRDLSELITNTYGEEKNGRNLPKYEISFHFARGYNDYAQFKRQYKVEGLDAVVDEIKLDEGGEE